jgi:hypothetical protein
MTARRPARPVSPYLTTASPLDLDPCNRIAHDIVSTRHDLLPSVERIMNAGLTAEQTASALELFRTSLATQGDPNRDPRVAIAHVSDAAGGPAGS